MIFEEINEYRYVTGTGTVLMSVVMLRQIVLGPQFQKYHCLKLRFRAATLGGGSPVQNGIVQICSFSRCYLICNF